MKTVAEALGVSVSTVGRSLADRSDISEEMKVRVRETANRLGYVVHSAAQSMRSGRSSLIGLIIPDVRNDFFGAAAMALARCCDEAGFQLVLAVTEDDPDTELRQVRGLSQARAAGVVIAASRSPRKETVSLLARAPTVELIRRTENAKAGWFGIDERRGVQEATEHLLGFGHRRIAFIGGIEQLSTGRERLAGHRMAFASSGLAAPDDLIRLGIPNLAFGAEALEELWRLSNPPTAVVTAGAQLTSGALEAIGRLGIAVPAQLSVVGFGDAPWFRWWGPGLTTIALPVYDLSLACGEYLVRQIQARDRKTGDRSDPDLRYQAMHRPTLVLRSSTSQRT